MVALKAHFRKNYMVLYITVGAKLYGDLKSKTNMEKTLFWKKKFFCISYILVISISLWM